MNRALALLLVGGLTLVAHLRATDGEFVFFDDPRFVVNNKHIETLDSPGRFFTEIRTATSDDAPTQDIYRPLRTLTYAWLYSIGGRDPKLFHGASVFLHALATVLLAWLILRAGVAPWAAAVGALAFGMHPRTVEVTAWICSLGDIWCALFMIASMLFYSSSRRGIGTTGAVVCFALALLGKEHALVLPGLWVAWDWWMREERPEWPSIGARAIAPGVAVIVAFLWWRSSLGANFAQVAEPIGGSHFAAAKTMLAGMGWYAGTTLFPHPPTFQARIPEDPAFFSLPVLLGVLATAGLAFWAWRGDRRERLGVVWFFLALIPVSNLIAPLKVATADRFLYFSLLGLAIGTASIVERHRWRVPSAIALALFATLTVHRIQDWKTSSSLVEAGLRVHPRSTMLLWADASQNAERAVALFDEGQGNLAYEYALNAERLYDSYFRNTSAPDQLQARIEVGKLQMAIGFWAQKYDPQEQWRVPLSRSMENFRFARQLQTRGMGRVIESEVRGVANAIVGLAIQLAEPRNRNFGKMMQVAMEALQYLHEQGEDTNLRHAQLNFAQAIHPDIRGPKPALSRQLLNRVLQQLEFERKRGVDLRFLRAQALYYRSILKDQPFDRAGLEAAAKEYKEAARHDARERRKQVYQARAYRTIAQLFDDFDEARKAEALLKHMLEVDAKKNPKLYRASLIQEMQRELETARQQVGRLTPK